jgi:hypothetical protein
MTATDRRQCRRSSVDADGQVGPYKELPKLTKATCVSFVSTQEGRKWLYGPSRAVAAVATIGALARSPENDPLELKVSSGLRSGE